MSGALAIAAALLAGVAVGLAYFASLRRSVDALPASSRPVPLIVGGLLARYAAVGTGLWLLAGTGDWTHLVAAAVGFTAARLALVRRALPARGRGPTP